MRVENRRVYVATNGKEFISDHECASYEEELNIKERLKEIETNYDAKDMIPCDGGSHDIVGTHYCWMKPANAEQIELLKLAFPDNYFDEIDIGKWLCIKSNLWDTYTFRSDLSDSAAYVKRLFEKFGCNVTITDENGNEVE